MLDFRRLTEITIFADSNVRVSPNYIPPDKFYKKWYNHFLEIEGYFHNYDIQITVSRGDIREAKRIAEENRPDSKYYTYKKNIKKVKFSKKSLWKKTKTASKYK